MKQSGKGAIRVFLIILSTQSWLWAQDIHFSQFNSSPILLNPACAGSSSKEYRFALNYRNQWSSVISPFQTIAAAFDGKLFLLNKKSDKNTYNHFGYGISIYNDRAGLSKITTNQVDLHLAYHIKLRRSSNLAVGIKTGVFQRGINSNGLKWDAQYNGKVYDASLPTTEPTVYQRFAKFDLGAGMLYKYYNKATGKIFEFGVSVSHLNKPKYSFLKNDPSIDYKYLAHTRYVTKLNDKFSLIPSAFYARQANHSELVGGVAVQLDLGEQQKENAILNTYILQTSSIQFGTYYRLNDAIIFMTAFEYNHSIMLGISYDVNVSKFTQASRMRGAIEFSLIYTKQKLSKLRTKY